MQKEMELHSFKTHSSKKKYYSQITILLVIYCNTINDNISDKLVLLGQEIEIVVSFLFPM